MDSKRLTHLLMLVSMALTLGACQFVEDNANDNTVEGQAVKGIISNGIVNIFSLANPNSSLGETRTDSQGNFSFSFQNIDRFNNIENLYFELTTDNETRMTCDIAEGCYERVSGNLVAFGDQLILPSFFTLSGISTEGVAGANNVNISPLSHIIISTAKSLDSTLSIENIDHANQWLQEAFDLDFDPLETKTTNLTALTDIDSASLQELQQGILSATLYNESSTVEWANYEQSLTSLDIQDLATRASDLALQLAELYPTDGSDQKYSSLVAVSQQSAQLASNFGSSELTIHTQPNSSNVQESDTVSLFILASGEGDLQYQWYKDGNPIPGETSATCTIKSAQLTDAGIYHAIVTDTVASVSSLDALISVSPKPRPVIITQQPSSFTGNEGEPIILIVEATGEETISYQWQKGGSIIPGETNSSLIIENSQTSDSGSYRVAVSNNINTVHSEFVTVTINEQSLPPSISQHPQAMTVTEGQDAVLSVTASGTGFLSYQWQKDEVALTGEYSDSLSLSPVTMTDAGSYRVVVSNSMGSFTSTPAQLTVLSNTVPVSITQQPLSQDVVAGQDILLSVGTTGDSPITYQWYKNSVALSGENASTLLISNAEEIDSGTYRVSATNGANSETSANAEINVTPYVVPVSISQQPSSQEIFSGQDLVLSIGVAGTGPIYYQWYKDGSVLLGENSYRLTIANTALEDSGNYRVTVSNSENSLTSSNATVNVVPEPAPVSITQQPTSQSLFIGQSVSLSVGVTGDNPISYQWYKDGVMLDGQTSSVLSISDANVDDSGAYSVNVSNQLNSINSNSVPVDVQDTPSIQLSWAAPEQRSNGETLPEAELSGYVIEYGFNQANLNQSVEIESAGVRNYLITDVGFSGTIYVRIASIDTLMQVSEFSDVIAITY